MRTEVRVHGSGLSDELRTIVHHETARLAQALRRAVEDEFPDAFSSVEWSLSPEAVAQMAALPALPAEVLFHAAREAVRNAAKHGGGLSSERPSSDAQGQTADALRPLNLRLSASLDKGLCITVQDDGVGFDTAAAPRGRGIALHSTMLAIIGGELRVESAPGVGTRVRLGVPVG